MEEHVEIVTDEGTIRGMVHYPDIGDHKHPTVVIIHGYFSANRVGPARLHVLIGRHLSRLGFVVLRCDALGVGDSDGLFRDVSLESELRDFAEICKRATLLSKSKDLVLIGHSMGANIAIRLANDIRAVTKLVLLSPEVRFRGGVDHLFTAEQLEQLENDGFTIRKGLHINASFIEALRSEDCIQQARDLQVPFVVLQGNQDELYDAKGAEALANANSQGTLRVIAGGDHNFLLPEISANLIEGITLALE